MGRPTETSLRYGLKAAVAALPAGCYANPTWKGMAYFLRDLGCYAGAVALLLHGDRVAVLVLAWMLGALSIGGLFIIGHDAAHGALFKGSRLAYAVGQIAMLPGLHAYSVWTRGHNRIHHPFPACQGLDFVWHPLTVAQYRALSPLRRVLHRLEWSAFGPGVYYARAIWWERIVRLAAPEALRGEFRRDRVIVAVAFVISSALLVVAGAREYGTIVGALWMWVKVLVVPWCLWSCMTGWSVYLQHVAPDVAWHARHRWTRFGGQVEATTIYRIPRWLDFFLHHIFLHVPHHVDPRIPFYGLPAATEALARAFPGVVRERPLSWRGWIDATRRCKLYDFERSVWLRYDGTST